MPLREMLTLGPALHYKGFVSTLRKILTLGR